MNSSNEKDEIEWSECKSLDEWVIRMIETKQTKTDDFKAALAFFGREKFKAIWEKHRGSKKRGDQT